MGLLKPNMAANAAAGADLVLTMGANESARIKSIRQYASSISTADVDVILEQRRVNQLLSSSSSGEPPWWVISPNNDYVSLWDVLEELGLMPILPLAKGETFRMTGMAGNNRAEIIYDLFDADDVQNNEPFGSRSDRYRLFQEISNSSIVTEAGDALLDQSRLDSVFPAFPGGEVVPPKTAIEILALFGAPTGKGTGAVHAQHTEKIKFVKDGDDLTDQDLEGFLFEGATGTTGATAIYTEGVAGRLRMDPNESNPVGIIVFDTPKRFEAGEELNVFAKVVEDAAGGDIAADEIRLGLIMDVIRL